MQSHLESMGHTVTPLFESLSSDTVLTGEKLGLSYFMEKIGLS